MGLVFILIFQGILLLSGNGRLIGPLLCNASTPATVPPYPDDDCQIEGGRYRNIAVATESANTSELCRQKCLDREDCLFADWMHKPDGDSMCYMKSEFQENALSTNQTGFTLVMKECGGLLICLP